MSVHLPLSGVIAPVVTPFRDDLGLALELYLEHAHWLLAQGMHYLSPFGTTGEALSLSVAERREALEALVDGGIDPARLMPGTGLCNAPETLKLCRHAVELGCAGVMLLPPFFYRNATDDGLYAYVDRLIHEVRHPDLRICLYHIPPMAGIGFSPALTRRLATEFPNVVVAYKDSSGDFEHTLKIREAAPVLSVFPGSECFLVPALEAGGAGCISATCNINPAAVRAVYDFATGACGGDGDLAVANHAMVQLRRKIEGYSPIPAIKGLLAHALGESRWRHVRPPLLPASIADTDGLRELLGNMLPPLDRL